MHRLALTVVLGLCGYGVYAARGPAHDPDIRSPIVERSRCDEPPDACRRIDFDLDVIRLDGGRSCPPPCPTYVECRPALRCEPPPQVVVTCAPPRPDCRERPRRRCR